MNSTQQPSPCCTSKLIPSCLSHFGNRFMVVEVGPEHPELVVADDPPVALLGLHDGAFRR